MLAYTFVLATLASSILAAPASLISKRYSTAFWGYTSVVNNPSALAWYSADTGSGAPLRRATTDYICYGGNVNAMPAHSDWLSFDQLWSINLPIMRQVGNSDSRIKNIHDAITQIAQSSRVDPRVILVMMMQESSGQCTVGCTGSKPNCGLLQAGAGSVSFDAANERDSIFQMIFDGVVGTASDVGFVQEIDDDGSHYGGWMANPFHGNPYAAARVYNSGHVEPSGNLDQITWGTPSYVNSIANRLVGWDGSNRGWAEKTICGFSA